MKVLVDSSVWIDYFRGNDEDDLLDSFITENLVVTNDLILTELVPYLKLRRQHKLAGLLTEVYKLELKIDWDQIMEYQLLCLRRGSNGIGISNLIIAQNAKQNNASVYSSDNDFQILRDLIGLKMVLDQ